jgi:hypothetical protein
MKLEGVTCLRYHKGVDGLGTCDDKCQWWVEGTPCPYWFEESTYQRIKGIWINSSSVSRDKVK